MYPRLIEIEPDGKSAWFGGGAYDGEVSRYLWARGYVATTGACDCVGMLSPGLGRGFGRHGGIYGLISDNLLQLNVVLGNGEAVIVNSTNHSDFLWGMKGAGHNFGIVTSFQMRIFPRGPDTWHYHNYV
ncbi:FAD-linked oxidoreductase OXR2 [Pseudocercospora fuligena]|uniref:FAD-linked oxidoreductase OXR2 n=1 Tax=Pseudocercospora fuligena TaxID=685502 RepID=A0A8H6RPD9_9PEZI|nr:FAD-linked oxidoreductase OXR2 [Pseudocercospora fuligena]